MLFFIKKEINYELYLKFTLNKMWGNKQNINNKYIILMKPKMRIFFWFKKIKEDDLIFLKIFNHLILLWLITSQKAKIYNLNSILLRGIKYFRFIFFIEMKKNNIYYFFNFLNEILLPITQKNSRKFNLKKDNISLCSFLDFGSFTNLRLSSNFYLNSVHEKLFMLIKLNNNLNINYYLNCLKI